MAKVLTGISGNLISAASAGFAPTNSADVSAIASAYQVVSATATQLYAGTAYVTSVNGAPLSASRAGNAANASLASSAYYDGTGRLISSLPDSAAVSAIASAYAESAASGKQDTLTFAYNAGSAISSINGSALAGQGGGGGGGSVVSPSGTIIVTDGTAIDASDSAVFVTGGYETSTAVQPSTRYMYDSPHTILSGMNISGADGIHFLWEQREQMGDYVQYSVSAFSGDEDADFISSQDKYVYDYETETGTVYPLDPSWKIARIDTCRLDGWTTFDLPTGSSILFEANLPLGSAVKPLQSRLQYGYDGAGHISSIEGSGVGGVVSSTGTTSGYLTRVNGKRIIGAPSAMAYYANTGFDTSFSAELGSISVATYTSTANVPLPNPVNAIYFSGFTGGRTTGRISAKMMDGTTWSSNIRTMGQTLFTASAEMSAARLIMSSTKYEYFYPRYSAGTYHASGDVVFPLPKASDYVPKSSYNVAFGTGVMATDTALAAGSGTKAASHSVAIGQTCSASAESVAFGFNTTANLASFAAGNSNSAAQSSMAVGYSNKASSYSISIGSYNSAYDYTVAMGEGNSGSSASLAAGMNCRAFAYAGAIGSLASATQGSFSNGIEVSAYWCSLAVGSATTATHRSLAAGTSASAFQRSMAQGVQCYASGDSFAQGGYVSASSNSFAQGYKLTAYNTAAAFGNYNLSGDGSGSSGAAFVIGDGTADEARHDLMVVTKNGEITMYSGTADTAGTGILSSIRALSANAGGVDSATVSAIASSYAESAASGKLDTTAFNSGDFYSTANPSGFVGSAYVDSAVSGKADASALSGYYTTANESGFITGVDLTDYATTAYVDSAVSSKADSSALSSYVPYSSLEYNTASAISGINGSALAAGSTYSAGEGIDITDDVISVETPVDIVAGPGIVIDNPDGNTLRVSVAQAEEVVLYDAGDSPSQAGPWQISEARTNFEWLDIVFGNDSTGSMKQVTRFAADSTYMKLYLPRYDEEPSYKWSTMTLSWNNTTASIKTNSVGRVTIASNGSVSVSTAAGQAPHLFQIIGIHRIANN